jgi:hypothetical protein
MEKFNGPERRHGNQERNGLDEKGLTLNFYFRSYFEPMKKLSIME